MSDADAVRDFYNRKAAAWGAKYARSGPLEQRLHLFERSLLAAVPPPADVLDLGCGTGHLAAHLANLGYRLTACDVADRMVDAARHAFPRVADWRLLPAGWTHLPFESGQFGAIVASSVLEYVTDLPAVLAESSRVLAPKGELIVTVPNLKGALRKAESLLRPLVPLARLVPSQRVRLFAEYLELSHHRLSPEGWNTRAALAGLVPSAPPQETSELLLLLRYRHASF
jgi:SAM-dependent methyltransferase